MEKILEKVEFKPLTSGLGFHPFSDGLPYAPVSPGAPRKVTTPSTGVGATAAGNPSFITRESILSTASIQTTPAGVTKPTFGFLYLVSRVLAYLLDTGLNLVLAGGCFAAVLWNQKIQTDSLFNSNVLLIAGLFFFAFSWAIITAQEIAFGTSLGKRIFRLTLTGNATTIFLRSFFFLPSIGFIGVGIIWSLFDSKKRCWHDLIVNLQPTSINPPMNPPSNRS